MKLARTLKFTHPHTGEVYTRTTDRDYTHVSFGRAGNKDRGIRWHMDAKSAEKRGNDYPVNVKPVAPPSSTPLAKARESKTCTVVSGAGGKVCGQPAVSSFHSNRSGKTYYECADHKMG